MAHVLRTQRLVLRRMAPEDAPALHRLMSDGETMRHWSTLPHRHLAETEAFIASTVASVAAGDADDFVMTLSGQVIGKVGLWRGCELAFLVDRDQWRRGYAAEAIRAVAARAFAQGRPRIEADVDPRNEGCLRLLDRLGFRRTGEALRTFRIGESWADSVYLALTPADRTPFYCCGG